MSQKLNFDEILKEGKLKKLTEYTKHQYRKHERYAAVDTIKAKVDWAIHNGEYLTEATFREVDSESTSSRQRGVQKALAKIAQWASYC